MACATVPSTDQNSSGDIVPHGTRQPSRYPLTASGIPSELKLEFSWDDMSNVHESQVVGDGPDGSGTASSKKGTRSRSGCVVCRARKVKCDERPGTCLNCESLSLECPGYGPGIVHRPPRLDPSAEPHRDLTEAGTKRKRTYRSCRECRTSKTRCSGQRPVCLRCSQKGVECTYDAEPKPAWARTVSNLQQNNSSSNNNPNHPPNDATPGVKDHTTPQNFSTPASHAHPNSSASAPPSVVRSPPQASQARSPQDPDDSHSVGPPASVTNTDDSVRPEPLAWLVSPNLPSEQNVRRLVDVYFANIHPLRCFGFIHKPTYMQRLDEGLSTLHPTENALLFIMCALGAKFYALEWSNNVSHLSSDFVLSAGNAWAKQAKNLIFDDLGDITLENLMASVLLQDHELRTGNYANAFMLTATAVRMAQALQVNIEHSTDILCNSPSPSPSASLKESRRRLMWSCFIMDCWVGSGVDQLTLLDERDINIQLPCQEQNFILQIPCVTERIDGKMLEFLSDDMRPPKPEDNMGLLAFFIQLTSLRKRVLKYIKHLDQHQPPWIPESEFQQLSHALQHWVETLPTNIQFTPTTVYMRKETSQLGALFLLHCTYHQTMVDLYRIGMPRLFKTRTPISFPPDQYGFFIHCQQTCFKYAKNVAIVIESAVRHGPGALADSWLWVITYDSIRIMLYYLTQVVRNHGENGVSLMTEATPLFQTSLKALKTMTPLFTTAKRCYDSAVSMLRKAGFGPQIVEENGVPEVPSQLNDIEEHSAPGTPAQVSPEQVLNPVSIYRIAANAVRERTITEPAASPLYSVRPSQSAMHSPVQMNHMSPPMNQPQQHHENQLAPLTTSFDDVPGLRAPAFTPIPNFNPNEPVASTEGPLLDATLDDFEMYSIIDFDGPWQLAGAAMGDLGAA